MANNEAPKANNSGPGGLFTTLASSPNQWVQIIIAGGLIVNTIMTGSNGKGIKDADRRLDYLRESMARQVKSVYDNQNFLFDFVDEVRASQDRIQTKLDIPHASVTPFPRQLLPEYAPPPYQNTYPIPYR